MLNQPTKLFFIILFLFATETCFSQELNTLWPEPTQTSKPWTRWWWMNNAVDKENLSHELNEFSEMGIGGVEITPIYGVNNEEKRTIEFLSPEFSEIIDYTIDQANRLGLGVDLPAGSGWRNGGPFVPREKGLWNLRIEKHTLNKGESWQLTELDGNVAAVSFLADGESKIIKTQSFTAPKNGVIYLAVRRKSGDKVKRPALGGEGWAIDTFDEDVTTWYLKEFSKRLNIEDGKVRCFFHDSFEYTGDFTPNFLEEFKKRRGYDLSTYLYVLAGDCKNAKTVARVKSDYRETLADLVLESFIQPMTDWANEHKSGNRNQAHGSPGNILDLYAACDIPETEFFGRLQAGYPKYYIQKFASSAAHVTGKKLVSSESFTWLDEHWTVTPTELMRATNHFFLAGINHMFFHGTCYSPKNDTWPGWLFYASTQVNNRNPLWREMPAFFKYIERTQTILQQSTPVNDVLIYWPYYDVAAAEGRIFNHIGVSPDTAWFYEQAIRTLSDKLVENGYSFDFVSDKQLLDCNLINGEIVSFGNTKYKAVVIPECEYIPVETMKRLTRLSSKGGTVVFDSQLPQSVPGLFQLEKREKELAVLKKSMKKKWIGEGVEILEANNVIGEKSLAEKGFQFLKMRMDSEDYYWIFNADTVFKNEWLALKSETQNYIFMNPMNGEIQRAESKGNLVHIQLEPEQAVFIKCTNKANSAPQATYEQKRNSKQSIVASWEIEFIDGGPVLPGKLHTDVLQSWTELGDDEARRFAGTVKYSTQFNWNGGTNSAIINLGEVKDCARVYLNGQSLGTLLGPTFKIRTDKLIKGDNKLVVEVTNVAANRIRDLDKRGVVWRKFNDINFVNIDYKPFDASEWEVREAGLLGPVTITGL